MMGGPGRDHAARGARRPTSPRGRRRVPGLGVPRLPRGAVKVVVALVLLALAAGGGYLWLRDSSLAEVRTVHISGVSAGGGERIERALRSAALGMTTLHVREDALRAAAKPFPIVKSVSAHADWPHTLYVEVVEYRPVAVVQTTGRRTPVSADGRLLDGAIVADGLPTVVLAAAPGGGRVTDRAALAQIAILSGVPAALRSSITRVWHEADGVHVTLANGPQLLFGDGSRPRAKWIAATRVLADESAKGASYIDVRIPGRVFAGTFPQDAAAAEGSTSTYGATSEGGTTSTYGTTSEDGTTSDGTAADGASYGTTGADGTTYGTTGAEGVAPAP